MSVVIQKDPQVNIALISPDGISVILFCRGIIRSLVTIPNSNIVVICDVGKYADEIESLGVRCVNVPMYRWFSPVKDIKYAYRLWKAVKSNKCDTLVNFCTKQNIYGTLAGKLAGVKNNYLHVVGMGSGFEKRNDLIGKIMRLGFVSLYRIVCKLSKKVWFTNKNDRKYFIEQGFLEDKKTVLSRNYLDTDEYALDRVSIQRKIIAENECEKKQDDRIIVMVARMIWQKGIKEFADAAKLLYKEHPDYKFILVAPLEPGSSDAVPEEYVKEVEKLSNFKWVGFQEDVKSFYAISELAVLPTYYKEGGYPRGLLEPMAMGKPVIAADSDDCRGAVEDGKNGFIVPIKNSDALAEKIEMIMMDSSLKERFGEYSIVKAKRDFDEKIIVSNALKELGLGVATQV